MTDPALALLRLLTHMTVTMPTLAQVAAANAESDAPSDDLPGDLARAMELGLVEASDDFGPETLFTLTTLGAATAGARLTFDSRRWASRKNGKLLGPPDGRYTPKKARRVVFEEEEPILELRGPKTEDDRTPLHKRTDPRQFEPYALIEMAERAERSASQEPKRQYNGDRPEFAPTIIRFYGLNAIWEGEEAIDGVCPYCEGKVIGIHAYCLKCHAAGMDRIIMKPKASARRQMPKHHSGLKGGV